MRRSAVRSRTMQGESDLKQSGQAGSSGRGWLGHRRASFDPGADAGTRGEILANQKRKTWAPLECRLSALILINAILWARVQFSNSVPNRIRVFVVRNRTEVLLQFVSCSRAFALLLINAS